MHAGLVDAWEAWEAWLAPVFTTREPRRKEFTVPGPAGERSFDVRLVPEFDAGGQVVSALAIARDVTERRQAEEALRRRAAELQRMNGELEEFAYVASHDLKAPLRGVYGLSAIIEEDIGERLDDENRERLRLLRRRVAHMDQLIEGLLTYARLNGQNGAGFEPVALDVMLEHIVRQLAPPSGFKVKAIPPLPALMADPTEVRQVLQNLIANAIDHHDRDRGTVWVHAGDHGTHWQIEVADDGPGIPPLARDSIFRMFTSSGADGHTGIGLAVVRKLVLRNGGTLEVADRQPRGTRFLVQWPKPAIAYETGGPAFS
jgi:signal transduction histidine kinase